MTKRYLTEGEKSLARSVFGDKINYDVIQISNVKWKSQQGDSDIVTPPGNTIYYPPGNSYYHCDISTLDINAQAIFIHEMTHNWQFQSMGKDYLARILNESITTPWGGYQAKYDYDDVFNGESFQSMTLERQAEFYQDYFILLNGGTLDTITPGGTLDATRTLQDFENIISSLNDNINVPNPNDSDYIPPSRGTINGAGYSTTGDKSIIPEDSPLSDIIETIKSIIGVAAQKSSPLVFDLDGDGIETTNLNDTGAVYFDHDQDGFAQASGWVTGGDGLLAIDLNEDGIINSGSELFGDQTGDRNGFEVLNDYDSNGDGKITAEDVAWDKLRMWVDANGDGYSQAGELHTLDSLNITEIDLAYTDVNINSNGNTIKETGLFTMNGNTHNVSDVYFNIDKTNSNYVEEYELDVRALFLPAMRGYGALHDLHRA